MINEVNGELIRIIDAKIDGDIAINVNQIEGEAFAISKGDKGDPFRFEDFTEEQLEQLRGLSAYQIAVQHGFIGTEEDFVNILLSHGDVKSVNQILPDSNGNVEVPLLTEDNVIELIDEKLRLIEYGGVYSVDPTLNGNITLETKNKILTNNVTVNQVPVYRTSNESGGTTVIIGRKG